MELKFTLESEQLRAALKAFGGEGIAKRIRKALDVAGNELSGEASERAYRVFNKNTGTGRLAQSIGFEVRQSRDGTPTLAVGVIRPTEGSVLRYAKVQDVGSSYLPGGVIKGKPWLAIPIRKNLERYGTPGNRIVTKGGVSGVYARDIKDDPERYGFEGTFWHNGTKGPVIMATPLGQSATGVAQSVPIFAMRRSVKQRGKRYLADTMEKSARSETVKALQRAFADA